MSIDLVKYNLWGTDIRLINTADFCSLCECAKLQGHGHYTNCTKYRSV